MGIVVVKGLTLFMIYCLFACLFMLIKNQRTYNMHHVISDAIYAHHRSVPGFNYEVDYGDMESYDRTLLRWYDWSYYHILPEDKFKIIEPYIKTKKD